MAARPFAFSEEALYTERHARSQQRGWGEMQADSPEYLVFTMLWKSNSSGRVPTPRQYEKVAQSLLSENATTNRAKPAIPSVEALIPTYGSFRQAFYAFCDRYFKMYPRPIPDYLLGWLTGRARILYYKDRILLRIIEHDPDQVALLQELIPTLSVTNASKKGKTKYIRCTDYPLIFTLKHLWEPSLEQAFRPTMDFLRGYVEGHSHIHTVSPAKAKRLVLWGPLVEPCREYVQSIGIPVSTRIFYTPQQYVRWHIHQKSLRKLRVILYPSDQKYVCNPIFRTRLFQI